MAFNVLVGLSIAKELHNGQNTLRTRLYVRNYLNSAGHGPSFHTSEFMNGYNAGFNACSSGGTQGGSNSGGGRTIEDYCNQYHDQLGLSQPCSHYVIGNQLQGPGTFFLLCSLVKVGVSTHTLGLLTSLIPCG